MADIKPMLLSISPFDSTKGTTIYFTFTGSKQTLENNLHITDKSTGKAVYDHEWATYEKAHHIPARILENGKTYIAKLRVKYTDGTYTHYSNSVEFKTFETPVLDITNIDGHGYVYNADITFITKYSQGDGEAVKTYRYTLYDENEEVLVKFPIRRPSATDPTVLTETAPQLEKGKGYFIECLIETVNGIVYSHRERFIPLYVVPSAQGVVQARDDSSEGFVRITSRLQQITGQQTQGKSIWEHRNIPAPRGYDTYRYIDNEWVVIPPESPVVFSNLGMNKASDFIMKVWMKDVPNNKMFLELRTDEEENGASIQFWKYENKIVAKKTLHGKTSCHRSNRVNLPEDVEYMLYVKVIEHRLDLNITIL